MKILILSIVIAFPITMLLNALLAFFMLDGLQLDPDTVKLYSALFSFPIGAASGCLSNAFLWKLSR